MLEASFPFCAFCGYVYIVVERGGEGGIEVELAVEAGE